MNGFWFQLGEIVLVNLVLSGDNALLIAMATSGLPRRQRRLAMALGIGGALLIRLVLTGLAAEVMAVPFVRSAGALLLTVIALKLMIQDEAPPSIGGGRTLLAAAGTILLADLTMSIDNVAAIAGMAAGNLPLLTAGLIISMGCMLVASVWIGWVLERVPQLMAIGAGILAWTAGRILAEDTGVSHFAGKYVWGILLILSLVPVAMMARKTPDSSR
ncbi:YjbE family putative metal transport protein [Effusibacillus pohliae]|uniref:YjbE family putative metal transport protein n=1 Tax=Effusibacillus pohliae TaxID=232270 RepID=UPI00035F50C6|nr:YjbE family putative metal transport protein [Effusibacillus pohliae]